jgi:hypothetical protein
VRSADTAGVDFGAVDQASSKTTASRAKASRCGLVGRA